jgi:L-threonylcarbamoyladenylate synthase
METAINALKSGGTILYPTDSIWGIGCDATNEDACQRLIKLKERDASKSCIVLVDSFQMVEKYIPDFHPICYDLADLATKPLTIIYPGATGLAKSLLAEDGSIGIRITKDPTCIKLIRSIRKPIVSTSANRSQEKTPSNYHQISDKIKCGVDAIVDVRLTDNMDTPSQIIKIGLDGSVKVIRA